MVEQSNASAEFARRTLVVGGPIIVAEKKGEKAAAEEPRGAAGTGQDYDPNEVGFIRGGDLPEPGRPEDSQTAGGESTHTRDLYEQGGGK